MSTPGRSPGTALDVDPADLTRAAGILESVAGSLSDGAPSLRRRPDAGSSSAEVATALGALAEAVAAVGGEVRAVAEATRTSAADFTATDQAVSGSFRQSHGAAVE